jgi:hypothetical protein
MFRGVDLGVYAALVDTCDHWEPYNACNQAQLPGVVTRNVRPSACSPVLSTVPLRVPRFVPRAVLRQGGPSMMLTTSVRRLSGRDPCSD